MTSLGSGRPPDHARPAAAPLPAQKLPAEKSADAYRTISEVAADLDLPQHVLRFWESRFPQVRPLKRAGGRRFYRPGDVVLLRDIRNLLHDEGYTIKGVQRLLRERGARERVAPADGAEAATQAKAARLINMNPADGSDAAAPVADDGMRPREPAAPAGGVPGGTAAAGATAPGEAAGEADAAAASPRRAGSVDLGETLALIEACERLLREALALQA